MSSKSISLYISKYYFKKINIFSINVNIFVLRGVFFSRYVQLKSSFSDEKRHQQWNLRHTSVDKLSKINVAKY